MTSPRDRSKQWPCDASGSRDTAAFGRTRESAGTTHETPELHRLLVESVRDYAIFALDVTGHVLSWNAGAERFEGWTADEIVGRHFSIFYPPEEIAAGSPDRELCDAVLHGTSETEGWRIRKDGTRFWANVVRTVMRDHSGELVGFATVARDLTDRRDADEHLRVSEERFRLLVQSVRDYAIFMLDPEGRVATWNEGAQRIKGYTADEIIGRHFSAFYPTETRSTGFPQHELEVAASTGRFEDEGWRLRKDGSLFWASVVITALRDPSGTLVGFAKVTRDLTERRQAEERAIADARWVAETETANRTKSEFLATLSHELRTPLNAIGGYAELLTMEVSGSINEAQRQYLERIATSQKHLLTLINELLNLSRVEAGQVEYDLGPVPLLPLLRDLEAMILPQMQAKDIDFEIVYCPADATAWADTARAQQILLNLLSNAVKFTPSGGRISLECSLTEEQVTVTVLDTGPGIPEDKREAIFQPFVQLGRSLTNTREGIGLGLAISRDLARGMSGDLKVSGGVGEGARLTLVLPRYTAEESASEGEP
jgi:PAS domain S-box-containing protein